MSDIEGIEKLRLRFAMLGKDLLDAAKPAMLESGDRVVQTARMLVPKDSGHLASTIKRSEVRKTKKGNVVVLVSAGDESTRVGAGNQFQLARLIEFGHQKRSAQPYMRPAWRQNKRSIAKNIRSAITAEIKKI